MKQQQAGLLLACKAALSVLTGQSFKNVLTLSMNSLSGFFYYFFFCSNFVKLKEVTIYPSAYLKI